jgi:uncharacterized protein YhaN
MKLLNLDLMAYGPFSGTKLDFTGATPGFHLVYGPNEAGKSSTLRALTNLLYGIPERTTDNFLHEASALRIGGRVCNSRGEELEFIRRKGRKDTLLNPDSGVLAESELQKYLGAGSRELFTKMHGLDQAELVSGGRELVAGNGEAGQILFGTALGMASMREVLKKLEQEAGELFKSSGSKPRINGLLRQFKDLKKQATQASLSVKEWEDHEHALQDAETAKKALERELTDLRSRMQRHQRLNQAVPKVGRLKELQQEIAELGEVTLLPAGFAAQRCQAQEELARARLRHDRLEKNLANLAEEMAQALPPENLLRLKSQVEELFQRSGEYAQAKKRLPLVQGELSQARSEARNVLRQLRPDLELDGVEALRLSHVQQAGIRELRDSQAGLLKDLEHAKQDCDKLSLELKQAETELERLPASRDGAGLRLALARVQEHGKLVDSLRKSQTAEQTLGLQLTRDLKRLPLWTRTLENLETAAVPSAETIAHFADRFADLHSRNQELARRSTESRHSLAETEKRILALQTAGAVPTEKELLTRREQRDQTWTRIKTDWLTAGSNAASAELARPGTAETYETEVGVADEIGDRLRRESTRVAELANLTAERQKAGEALAELQSQLDRADLAEKDAQTEWLQQWATLQLTPLSPREMTGWHRQYEKIIASAAQWRQQEAESQALSDLMDKLRRILQEALEKLGENSTDGDLESLTSRADNLLQMILRQEQTRDALAKTIRQLETRRETTERALTAANDALAHWKQQWTSAVTPLGCPENVSPAAAGEMLEDLQRLFGLLETAEKAEHECMHLKKGMVAFADAVAELCRQVAPDLRSQPAELSIVELSGRLRKAQEDAARLRELQKQELAGKQDLQETVGTMDDMQASLKDLCRQAGSDKVDLLPEIERRSDLAQQRLAECAAIKSALADFSGGGSVERLVEELETIDPDTLPAEILSLETEIAELERQRSQLDQTIGTERTQLAALQRQAGAAELAEQGQGVLAQMRGDAERYAALRLASAILRRAIERYREANQGPILRRASEFFRVLTQDSFCALVSDYDNKDQPILKGERSSGDHVTVDGMSEGTCDQLYLALRLASLEQQFDKGDPMPLILDDILVNFDDARSKAALTVLAEFSRRTQVIFFTHHAHLRDLAKVTIDETCLKLHELGTA